MPKKINRIGQRYGSLVVLSLVGKGTKPGMGPTWKCRCDCGTLKDISSNYLRRYPHTQNLNCGCMSIFYKWKNTETGTINSAWAGFKNQAKKRNIDLMLSYAEWYELTQQPCHYCGAEKTNTHKSCKTGTPFRYNGIDRKNSAKGYNPENCVASCVTCNMAKRLMDEQEFVQWITRTYIHINNRKTAYTGV